MTLHVSRSANRIMRRRGPPVSGLMAMKNICFYTESTESIGNLENNFLKSLLGQNNHGLYKICHMKSASASGIFCRDWLGLDGKRAHLKIDFNFLSNNFRWTSEKSGDSFLLNHRKELKIFIFQ